ncbi:MAG TPA: M20/M25/M40 family metallo-hydrolase [Synergistaceae bacterium]|nr:M20/M25/M40 family metallo-hydrolase [Synergistaceae bacterium]
MLEKTLFSRAGEIPGAVQRLAALGEAGERERQKAEALLTASVGISSETFREEAFARFFEEHLPLFGWERIWRDEAGNCIASRGKGSKELLLLGHMDTVPGGPSPRVKGNLLFGRGSVDAKGSLCAFAVAGGKAPLSEEWRITLVGVVGEEVDSRGMRHFMRCREKEAPPAGCLVGEPSGISGITLGYRGRCLVRLRDEDGGAHRSGDSGPQTRVLRGAAAILAWVEERDSPEEPVIRRPSGSVLSMKGIEAGCRSGEILLDIRLPLGADSREWGSAMLAIGKTWGVSGEVAETLNAFMTSRSDPLVRAFRVALRREGYEPKLLAKGGTADLNHAAAWNCPLAAYGPGDSRLDHTAEEHISLEEYCGSITVLEKSLFRFMES